MADFQGDLPDSWGRTEKELFEDLMGDEPEILGDHVLQLYFHEALFDRELSHEDRGTMYDQLERWLWDEYGIDFELDFDWLEYREWYDKAA